MKVSIYIKTSFKGNPKGAGKAAAIISYEDGKGKLHNREHVVKVENETKNALYLKICIHALRTLLKPCEINLYMDCQYIKSTCDLEWIKEWQKKGWVRATGKPPANIEDWKQFFMLTLIHRVHIESYIDTFDMGLDKLLHQGVNDA